MHVLVALLALCRRRFEIHIRKLRFHPRRTMAPAALNCPMRSYERERCCRVVEPDDFFPVFRRVAGLAPQWLPFRNGL